jgi:hypothetical protein
MDSNDVHRHKHWHMHTHHYIARICMFRCMFRIVCLDVCLGFILRKNQFSKQMWTTSLKPFPNKPWDPISHCIFLFHFLNQISMNSNPILTIFCNSLIQPHYFLISCPWGLFLFFKIQFSNLKSTNKNKNIFWERTTVDLIP